MPENLITTLAPPGAHELDLAVNISGDTITIPAGPFRAAGVDYALSDDEMYTAVSRPHETEVIGYIVLDTQNGNEPRLFVDEIQNDGVDAPYDFGRSGDFILLFYLFQFILPADSTDLSAVTYNRWVVVEDSNAS